MVRKHIVNRAGQSVLVEDVGPEAMESYARDFFESLGGADFFHRLTTAFHRLVSADEVLGPLFHRGADTHAKLLAAHYIRMYGTPDLSQAWDPAFLRAHIGAVLGRRHRDRWLALMRQAGEEIGAPEPGFSDFMASMVIASGDVTATSRGAALARGIRIDRDGEVVG